MEQCSLAASSKRPPPTAMPMMAPVGKLSLVSTMLASSMGACASLALALADTPAEAGDTTSGAFGRTKSTVMKFTPRPAQIESLLT